MVICSNCKYAVANFGKESFHTYLILKYTGECNSEGLLHCLIIITIDERI